MALTSGRPVRTRPSGRIASLRARAGGSGQALTWQLGTMFVAVLLGTMTARPETLRLALAASAIVLAGALAARAGPGLVYLLILWTAVMGMVRRLLSGSGVAGQADPLLLVAVVGLIALTAAAADRGAFRDLSRLASAVLLFNIFTFFSAFNPLQGSVKTGLTGLVFLLVPVLAFWVGRGLCNEAVITRSLRLVAVLGVAAAVYGLIQTFVGFPPWDERWIEESGYDALNVDKVIRGFGSFASAQEYSIYLGIAIVVWAAYGFRPGRALLTVGALTVLAAALFYVASRSPLVTTIFAVALVLGSRRLRNPVAAVLLGMAAVALIPTLASQFTVSSATGTDRLAGHQITGLADPFSEDSTLAGHLELASEGMLSVFEAPLGSGASVVNIASANIKNTEFDPSNVAVALGIPGLLAYLVILVEAFKLALRRAREPGDFAARAALGIIAVTILQWTNGGLYAVAFLPWLMMGWLDGEATRR